MNPKLQKYIQWALGQGLDDGAIYQFLKDKGHQDDEIRSSWSTPEQGNVWDELAAPFRGAGKTLGNFAESIGAESTNAANPLDVLTAAGKAGIKSLPQLPHALAETAGGVVDAAKMIPQSMGMMGGIKPEEKIPRLERAGSTLASLGLMEAGGRGISGAMKAPPVPGGLAGETMDILPPEPVSPRTPQPQPEFRSAPSVLPQIEHTIDPNLGPQQAGMNQPRAIRAPIIDRSQPLAPERPQLTSRDVAPEHQFKHPEPPAPETPSQMPMPESGFMEPPALTTVEAMKQAVQMVGPKKFQSLVQDAMAKRQGVPGETYDPAGLEMTVTESVARGIVDGTIQPYSFPEIAPEALGEVRNLTQGVQESIAPQDIQALEKTGKSLAKAKSPKPPASIARNPTPPELTPAEQVTLNQRLGNSGQADVGGKTLYSSLGIGSPYFWYRFGPRIMQKLGSLGSKTATSPTVLGLPFAQQTEEGD